MKSSDDTIVSLSSPPGSGLRAIVRMSGPNATSILQRLMPSDDNEFVEEASFHWKKTELHVKKEPDTRLPTVVYLMKKPRSYTCEDVIEFHIPGSIPLAEHLIDEIQNEGARMAEPGEFTERAFLNGRIDITQAEAVLSIVEAKNEEERKLALGQLEGTLSEKIREVRNRLKHVCAYVESALDFSDQDIDVINRDEILSYLQPLRKRIKNVLKSGKTKKAIREDPRAVIYGKPNAGKSSLFNELIEEDRSIVTEIAGTTRDTIEGTLIGPDRSIRLFDTAGVERNESSSSTGGADNELKEKMEDRAEKALQNAHIVLHVVEGTDVVEQDSFPQFPSDTGKGKTCINVLSKSDLLSEKERNTLQNKNETNGKPDVITSSVSGEGIDTLQEELFKRTKKLPDTSGEFRLNVRHMNSLEEAKDHLERAEEAVRNDLPYEFIAADLREGLNSLGKIVGEVGIEDILDTIFSEFCIGK